MVRLLCHENNSHLSSCRDGGSCVRVRSERGKGEFRVSRVLQRGFGEGHRLRAVDKGPCAAPMLEREGRRDGRLRGEGHDARSGALLERRRGMGRRRGARRREAWRERARRVRVPCWPFPGWAYDHPPAGDRRQGASGLLRTPALQSRRSIVEAGNPEPRSAWREGDEARLQGRLRRPALDLSRRTRREVRRAQDGRRRLQRLAVQRS